MAKKLNAGKKGWITKLFKEGKLITEIRVILTPTIPKITLETVRRVIRKHLEKLALELWADVVKQGGKCEISGKTDNLEAHHLIGKKNKKYRYDVSNGICLNSYYHTLNDKIAAHGSTNATFYFAEWMKENRPGQWLWFLENCTDITIVSYSIDELLEICTELEGMLNTKLPELTLGERKEPT